MATYSFAPEDAARNREDIQAPLMRGGIGVKFFTTQYVPNWRPNHGRFRTNRRFRRAFDEVFSPAHSSLDQPRLRLLISDSSAFYAPPSRRRHWRDAQAHKYLREIGDDQAVRARVCSDATARRQEGSQDICCVTGVGVVQAISAYFERRSGLFGPPQFSALLLLPPPALDSHNTQDIAFSQADEPVSL